MKKEACVEHFMEALTAQKRGADRVELCENLFVGGTTPSYGTIKKCIEDLEIPTFVMIRPRGGNFVYNAHEIDIMKEDISMCKKLGVKAVVFGVLNQDNTVDTALTQQLVELSRPMKVTFHKAIDDTPDLEEAVVQLCQCGVDRILSSGGKATAIEGAINLNKMIKIANNQLQIVVAGGVTNLNLSEVIQNIPSQEFHGKKIVGSLSS